MPAPPRVTCWTLIIRHSLSMEVQDVDHRHTAIGGLQRDGSRRCAAAGLPVGTRDWTDQRGCLDGEGHLLAQYTVRATRLTLANSSTEATQSAGTTATDAAGQFSFTGLRASSYLVEVLSGHEVLAGASLTLGEGTMHVSGVTLAPLPGGRGYPRAWVFTPIVRLFRHVRIKRHPSFWAPRRR